MDLASIVLFLNTPPNSSQL